MTIAQDLGGVVLLPCPFCGGRGEVGGIPWVECQACGASGPHAETEAAAIAAWNRRAHSAEIAGALRDAKETMLSQVKWESCDCGCPQGRTPTDAVSVTWLRAVQQVEIAAARAEEGK